MIKMKVGVSQYFVIQYFVILAVSSVLMIAGCDKVSTDASGDITAPVTDKTKTTVVNTATDEGANGSKMPPLSKQQGSAKTTLRSVDWKKLDTGISPVEAASFDYPFAPDSAPVQSYAKLFQITPSEAQHSLTLGMASNEPLTELLKQLGDDYVSHEITDGKSVRLLIYTNNNIIPSQYNYVISDDFARGLVLPIEVLPIEMLPTDKPPIDKLAASESMGASLPHINDNEADVN